MSGPGPPHAPRTRGVLGGQAHSPCAVLSVGNPRRGDGPHRTGLCHACVRHACVKGTPQTRNLFIKNCVLILTRLNFSHLQSPLHLMRLSSSTLMPLSASAVVCPTSSTSTKRSPSRAFFIRGNKKKVTWDLGQDQVTREGRAWGSRRFGPETAEHSVWSLTNHPQEMGKHVGRAFK